MLKIELQVCMLELREILAQKHPAQALQRQMDFLCIDTLRLEQIFDVLKQVVRNTGGPPRRLSTSAERPDPSYDLPPCLAKTFLQRLYLLSTASILSADKSDLPQSSQRAQRIINLFLSAVFAISAVKKS